MAININTNPGPLTNVAWLDGPANKKKISLMVYKPSANYKLNKTMYNMLFC